jgi:iron(III) transport system ATP-binding protein
MHHHMHSYPYTLSGGEQQRVALARALAPKPHVLLMDEPFSNLDHRLRDQIRQSTIDLLIQTATTTVIVTHDPEEALQIADQIILMHQGQIIQIGTPKQLYLQPSTLFAARYFSALNEIPAQRLDQQIKTIFGQVTVPKNLADTKNRFPAVSVHIKYRFVENQSQMQSQRKSFHPALWGMPISYVCNLL